MDGPDVPGRLRIGDEAEELVVALVLLVDAHAARQAQLLGATGLAQDSDLTHTGKHKAVIRIRESKPRGL